MHDFICCEDAQCMSLTAEELMIKPGVLYSGPIFFIVNSSHLLENACIFPCKECHTLCDIFTTMGAALATTNITNFIKEIDINRRKQQIMYVLQPGIGVDTSLIRYFDKYRSFSFSFLILLLLSFWSEMAKV